MSINLIVQKPDAISFEARRHNSRSVDKRAMASAFVNMDDRQLRDLAYVSARREQGNRKQKKSLSSSLIALPIAAVFTDAILTKDKMIRKKITNIGGVVSNKTKALINKNIVVKLSDRVSESVKTGAQWGFILVMLGIYDSMRDALVSKTPSLQRFKENHPLPAFLVDLFAFVGLAGVGFEGAKKVANKMNKETPTIIDELNSLKDKLKKGINASVWSKKVLPAVESGVEKFAKNAPLPHSLGRFAIANAIWIVLLNSLLNRGRPVKVDKRAVEHNYNELKEAQFKTAKHLVNMCEVERSILRRDSHMAGEMEDEFDKTLG